MVLEAFSTTVVVEVLTASPRVRGLWSVKRGAYRQPAARHPHDAVARRWSSSAWSDGRDRVRRPLVTGSVSAFYL